MWKRTLQKIGGPQACKLIYYNLKKHECQAMKFNEMSGPEKAGPE